MEAKPWLRQLTRLALEPRCCLCGLPCQQLQTPLCQPCHLSLPFWLSGCPTCGMPLKASNNSLHCGDCQNHPKPYQQMHLLGWYQTSLQALITRFKYQGDLRAGKSLTQAWLSYCQPNEIPDCLIPVPIHRHKLANRGFNQASFIAHQFGKALHIPIDALICKRIAKGEAHITQSRKQRLRKVKQLYQSQACPYAHVALVDDVVTTQATVMTLAQQLLAKGAKRVDVWALARTP